MRYSYLRFTTLLVLMTLAATGYVLAMEQKQPEAPKGPTVEAAAHLPKDFSKIPAIKNAPLKDDYVLGKISAPVTLIEYASLSCPHCAAFHNEVLPSLQKKYIDTGKVRLILRHYPGNLTALKATMLVHCAAADAGDKAGEKYYAFSKVLFDAQKNWAFDVNYLTSLKMIAKVGGMSEQRFDECVNSKEGEMKILQAKKDAVEAMNIPHTPYFVLSGTSVEDGGSIANLSKLIDKELGKK